MQFAETGSDSLWRAMLRRSSQSNLVKVKTKQKQKSVPIRHGHDMACVTGKVSDQKSCHDFDSHVNRVRSASNLLFSVRCERTEPHTRQNTLNLHRNEFNILLLMFKGNAASCIVGCCVVSEQVAFLSLYLNFGVAQTSRDEFDSV